MSFRLLLLPIIVITCVLLWRFKLRPHYLSKGGKISLRDIDRDASMKKILEYIFSRRLRVATLFIGTLFLAFLLGAVLRGGDPDDLILDWNGMVMFLCANLYLLKVACEALGDSPLFLLIFIGLAYLLLAYYPIAIIVGSIKRSRRAYVVFVIVLAANIVSFGMMVRNEKRVRPRLIQNVIKMKEIKKDIEGHMKRCRIVWQT